MNTNYKGFNSVLSLIDNTVGTVIGNLGAFAALLFFMAPVIFLCAGIKWLFNNGYLAFLTGG